MIKISNRGETIVEVLISIAVVAGTLAGAYYLLNRSYRQTQAAVERTSATKAAESSIEILRTLPKNTLNKIEYNPFCLSQEGNASPPSDSQCTVDNKYRVSITKNTSTYSIYVEWDGLIAANEKLTLYYRP